MSGNEILVIIQLTRLLSIAFPSSRVLQPTIALITEIFWYR